jgi:hypothetical protein
MLLFLIIVIVVVILIIIVIGKITILVKLFILFLDVIIFFVVFLDVIVRNRIQRNRVRLRHLKFGLALRTAEDFSLFYFVLIHIDFRRALRATEHVSILRLDLDYARPRPPGRYLPAYYIPQLRNAS